MRTEKLIRVNSLAGLVHVKLPDEITTYVTGWLTEDTSHLAFYSEEAALDVGERLLLRSDAPAYDDFAVQRMRTYSNLDSQEDHNRLLHTDKIFSQGGIVGAELVNNSTVAIRVAVAFLAVRVLSAGATQPLVDGASGEM